MVPLGFKQQVRGTIRSLGRTIFWKWKQRGLVLEGPMRRDLSEERRDRNPRASRAKALATHLRLSSPGSSRLRIPRTVGVFILTRLNLVVGGNHEKPELPSSAEVPCPPPQP